MATAQDIRNRGLAGFVILDEFGNPSSSTPGDAVTAQKATETTSTPASVTLVASTAINLLAANAARIRATIYNPLATSLFVRKATLAGSPATVAAGGYDFVIPSGGIWISDPYEYLGGLNGICATAGAVNVSETV